MGEEGLSGAAVPETGKSMPRLEGIDMLRGLAMVVMAIDHSRDFFSNAHFYFDPLDLAHTTPAFFLTRWITNFCAPVFIFLTGTGAFLSQYRGRGLSRVQRTLVSRGLWLVLLELTVVRFGWYFNFDLHYLRGAVIWAIGWSMVALAGLLFLPRWAVTLIGCAMVAGHNLLDGIRPESLGAWGWLWQVLHVPGMLKPWPGVEFKVVYPLIPWIGVMAAGYGFGSLLLLSPQPRKRWVLGLGLGLTLAFVMIRATNWYGDPSSWTVQESALFTLFSFIDCTKYPPSLLYLLMTLGPALAALAWLDHEPGRAGRTLVTFGRVPFFYYVLHLPLLHGLAVAVAYWRYGEAQFLYTNPPWQLWPLDYRYDLAATYAAWALVVAGLYPACRWFAGLKARRRDWWLSYL